MPPEMEASQLGPRVGERQINRWVGASHLFLVYRDVIPSCKVLRGQTVNASLHVVLPSLLSWLYLASLQSRGIPSSSPPTPRPKRDAPGSSNNFPNTPRLDDSSSPFNAFINSLPNPTHFYIRVSSPASSSLFITMRCMLSPQNLPRRYHQMQTALHQDAIMTLKASCWSIDP